MKINKFVLPTVIGLSMASFAQAEEIYLTGSTAARAAVYATMMNPGSVFTAAPTFTGFGGSGAGDTYMAFQGNLLNGNPCTINCYWSGSEAGIANVGTPGMTVSTFMADSVMNGLDNAGTPGTLQSAQVDVCMADNAQSYSPAGANLDNGNLTGAEVGVVPFKWLRNNAIWQGNNVTDSQIHQALGVKGAVLAAFTGNAGDTNSYIYVAGRDASSGTRVNALGECGWGITTPVNQVMLSGGLMQVEAVGRNGNIYIGNYGQSSGGTLAKSLVNTSASADMVHTNITGFSVIAYLGVSDANTATGPSYGAVVLNYDGVPYSVAAIEEGQYGFWGNEYVYKNPGYAGEAADVGAVYGYLTSPTTGISAQADNNAVISLAAMHCTRVGPTSDPAHN